MTDHPTTPEQVIAAMRDAVVGRRARYGEPADFCAAVAKRWSLDLARFGLMIQAGGRWGDKTIISRDSLDQVLLASTMFN